MSIDYNQVHSLITALHPAKALYTCGVVHHLPVALTAASIGDCVANILIIQRES